MANVSDIINYYVNLLIIQYHNKPKAQATIALLGDVMLASGILFDIEQGFNIDTAIGKQLDILGKYVGVDRYYSQIDLTDYFAAVLYSQYASLPTEPPIYGCSTYATFNDASGNGTVTYGEVITSNNALSDDDFRMLLKFQILINNSNFSFFDLDKDVHDAFPGVRMESISGTMSMVYFLTAPYSSLLIAALFKKLLPHPMGVNVVLVNDVVGKMFGLTTYGENTSGYISPFGCGCSTYADYGTLPGTTLTYSQISEG